MEKSFEYVLITVNVYRVLPTVRHLPEYFRHTNLSKTKGLIKSTLEMKKLSRSVK